MSVKFSSVGASYGGVAAIAHLLWNEPFGWPQFAGLLLIGSGIPLIHQH
jgi:multidrug transporter EmrE-like cation transporter